MPGILHFGLGNFHRAHQAAYTALANGLGGEQWRITGVSLRSPKIRDILLPQGFDYTLMVSDRAQTSFERISVIDDILVSPRDSARIIASLASQETKIVTLTVTEKGYHLKPDGQNLDLTAVESDLSQTPQTIYGYLAQGLAKRRDDGAGPLTILSCDNLASNGDTLARTLSTYIDYHNPALADFLLENITFPNCMVDRITPATTEEVKEIVFDRTGCRDAAPVATEAFSEWVIEDKFATARPNWDKVGARVFPDVSPFELRKLRLLNGAHSYLAYAGTLAGYAHVHEAIDDPILAKTARAIMTEAAETLPDTTKADALDYANSLIERFSNPSLHHKLRQIAMDGSQKLPIRLLATCQDRRALGLESPAIATAISAWKDFVISETGQGRELQDPMAHELVLACQTPKPAETLLSLIGGPALLANQLI